jgi:probable HAF family extracellular repeat protein
VRYDTTDLGTLGGTMSSARALNDAGDVAGQPALARDRITRAFVYRNGAMQELPNLGGDYAAANAMNNQGQVVGVADLADGLQRHAVLFDAMRDIGTYTILDLGTRPGHAFSTAFAINDTGLIFGASGVSDLLTTAHAAQFVPRTRNGKGEVIDLGTLGLTCRTAPRAPCPSALMTSRFLRGSSRRPPAPEASTISGSSLA